MDDGDKAYLIHVVEQIVDGRIVAIDFQITEKNNVEVPVIIVETPDGTLRKLLIFNDDMEDAPGWLELGE